MPPLVTPGLLRQIAEDAGVPLSDLRALPGEHGAMSAATTGGRRVVLKVSARESPRAPDTAALLQALQAQGFPVPSQLARGRVGTVAYTLQQMLPGLAPRALAQPAWRSLHDVHLGLRGLAGRLGLRAPHEDWTDRVRDTLSLDGAWAPQWNALARSAPSGAAFVDAARRRLDAMTLSRLPGDDVVHCDLHHGNLLVTGEQLTGVVDWDDWTPGDGRADLVTLLFAARTATSDPALADTLLRLIRAELEPELRWVYAVRDIVRTLGWFALRHADRDVPAWLAASTALLRELER